MSAATINTAKPAGKDPMDQVKFLVTCIAHTEKGRPDFAAVATELGIVSKAAAQKRYERMLKANNVTTKAPAVKEATCPTTPKRKTASAPASGRSKKSKGPVKKNETEEPSFKKEDNDEDPAVSDSPITDHENSDA